MEPRNRFRGMNSASLFSLAGRYDNPFPPRCLAPSVSDPYSFFPDPEVEAGGQYGSGSRALMTKNWQNYSWKKNLIFFLSKTAIYLSLGLYKVCPRYRRRLQLTKEAIQHFKTWIFSTFVGHFCPPGSGSGFRIRIRIHLPDWIRIQSGSGSETLLAPIAFLKFSAQPM